MIERLRSWFGVMAALCGLLIVLPRIAYKTWRTQLVLNEIAWLPAFLGAWAAVGKRPVGRVFGLVGMVLSAVPLARVRRATRDMDKMMSRGLGEGYDSQIPAHVKPFLRSQPLAPDAILWHQPQVRVDVDISYKQTALRPLNLDVYHPPMRPLQGDSYPAVIVIHGGGWYRGDKGSYFSANNRHLAALGMVVFDIQYRFTSTDGTLWPAQLKDLLDAIAWVQENAATYHINTDKIVLYGRSAGGQMALRAAYDENVNVAAVISAYAPTDLRYVAWDYDPRVVKLLDGPGHEQPEAYSDASPVDFVRPGLPPTLLMHGFMDTLVTPLHAENLNSALHLAGVPSVLLRVPWGRHGFDALPIGIGAQVTQYYVDRFLAWSLYR